MRNVIQVRKNRIKDVVLLNVKSLDEKTNPDYEFKYIDIGNVNQNGVIEIPETIYFKDAPSRARRVVRKDDVIVSTVRTYLKAVAFFKEQPQDIIASTGFAILSPLKKVIPEFLSYYCQSEKFINSVIISSKGVSYPAINASELTSLAIILPSLTEQTAIAQYLAAKSQAIDKKINLLTKKADYYKELRKSIINYAVCKGLDKKIMLKESGVDWIGKIPEHWEVKRGKDLFLERSIKNYPEEPLLAASQKYGVVLKSMLDTRSMEAQKDFENFKLVNIKDFVISLRSFEGGFEMALYKGIISPVYTVFSVNRNLVEDYYKHLFKSVSFISNLKTMITGIRDGQSIKFVEVQNTFFPIPPKEEQNAIANYLDENTKKIDAIVSNIGKQIDTLKELRKTLINDVVTGKIKVVNN